MDEATSDEEDNDDESRALPLDGSAELDEVVDSRLCDKSSGDSLY